MDIRELRRLRRLVSTGVAKALREDGGCSLGEIADEARVDKSTLWRWENGRRRPRAGPAAARYLRVLEDLASGG